MTAERDTITPGLKGYQRFRRYGRRIGLLLLICLATGELVLQFVLGNNDAAPFETTDDGRCISLAPGSSVEYTGSGFKIDPVVHDVNDMGFRGPERPMEKAAAFRISVLGDSYVYGMGVATDQTLSAQLERILQKREYEVEVLNFGVPALDFFNTIDQLRYFAGKWDSDLILFQFSDVDPEKCALLSSPILCWFMGNVRLTRIAYRFYKTMKGDGYRERYLGSGAVPDGIVEGMRDLKELSERIGARLVVMVFYDPWDDLTSVTEVFKDMGIPWISVDRAGTSTIPREGHFSVEGNRSVAVAIADELVHRNILAR